MCKCNKSLYGRIKREDEYSFESLQKNNFSWKQKIDIIKKMVERSTKKPPIVIHHKFSDTYTCPYCKLHLIQRDEKKWFAGKKVSYCTQCGQAILWGKK